MLSVPITVVSWAYGNASMQLVCAMLVIISFLSLIHERAADRGYIGYVRKIMEIMGDHGKNMDFPHRIMKMSVVYKISSRLFRPNDQWFRKIVLAPEGDSTIAYLHLMYIGNNVGLHRSFDRMDIKAVHIDPHDVIKELASVSPEVIAGHGGIEVVPTVPSRQNKRIGLQLLFGKPIAAGEHRAIRVSGTLSGVWNPLRRWGRDSGVFHLEEKVEELEISIIFPACWGRSPLRLTPVSAPDCYEGKIPGDLAESENNFGEKQISWKIRNAAIGDYRYNATRTDAADRVVD